MNFTVEPHQKWRIPITSSSVSSVEEQPNQTSRIFQGRWSYLLQKFTSLVAKTIRTCLDEKIMRMQSGHSLAEQAVIKRGEAPLTAHFAVERFALPN